jgi:carboxypeptidase Taq
MARATTAYQELCDLHQEAATLHSVSSLLYWDQETYMPAGAAAARADQLSLMAGLLHERHTSPRIGELLAACEADPALVGRASSPSAANIREMRRDYDLATKLPRALVTELAKVASQSQEAWKTARADSNFALFAPWLTRMLDLSRRKAECLGVPPGPDGRAGEPYDALLDLHEPGLTARHVESIFTPLRSHLTDLVGRVASSRTRVPAKWLRVAVDPARQHAFGLQVLAAMGFDLEAGRLDTTTHPFCDGIGPGDTRLTTRYRGEAFTDALYGTMHEAGHGLYEQGLPKRRVNGRPGFYGQPLAEAASFGLHESQSRLWENFVGRSREFWTWALPRANRAFGKALAGCRVSDLYAAVNRVTPSFVRVEADETTYNLHVMIRFELERALLANDLPVKDLPAEWRRRYKDYLGVEVPSDDGRLNHLQDVHWSAGLFGYFPTYTLGNLYAAQFWEQIEQDVPDLRRQLSRGEFLPLRDWLRDRIHRHGRRYRAVELCRRITGRGLSSDPLKRHLTGKAETVYGI